MDERKIKEYADILCREHNSVHITQIKARNELIISKLMKKFKISYEYARYCFENNNDR